MTAPNAVFLAGLCGVALAAGCAGRGGAPDDPRRPQTRQLVRQRWGKSLEELPTVEVVIVSPHNENICNEFEWAFSLHHAAAYGQNVRVVWRDVAGGSTAILRYLLNVYAQSDTAEIDVVWGGGEDNFEKLAAEGILEPMKLPKDVLDNIPAVFGGLEMYDPDHRWCGSAVSGFGFLYNLQILRWARIPPPRQWDDLARPECLGQVCLADPMQSGSAAAAYEMIVQSAPTWPEGWAKLLAILGNAKRFLDSAGAAANGPVIGEAPVATCIDFYGATRIAEAPEELFYVSPRGQTAFSPDPIGILKNAPNPQIAQRLVDFVLSRRGQALWALRVGEKDGPIRNALGRQPIRRDVYRAFAGRMSAWIVDPYEAGNELKLDLQMRKVRFGVLRRLVRAAAIDNLPGLQAARRRLIETSFDPQRLADFNRLPENVATREKIVQVAALLGDKTQDERICTGWQRLFREKYKQVAR